ncbi:MAG: DUF302 domain-containing protein [Acidobacteriaceae bacterium]
MELKSFGFGYSGELTLRFDQALERAKEVLARHGFGVQAEIQISNALKTKLGVDVPREVILGVCNPGLAYRAIQVEPEITVLLPCNVTVRETANGTHIAAADAQKLVDMANDPDLRGIALQAEKHLMEALVEL